MKKTEFLDTYKWLWSYNVERNKYNHYIIRMDINEAKLLSHYCQLAKEGIIEIGRFRGGSTYIILDNSNVPVYSIDIDSLEEIDNQLRTNTIRDYDSTQWNIKKINNTFSNPDDINISKKLQKFNNRLTLINKPSVQVDISNEINHSYDVLFLDGNHLYNNIKNDVQHYWSNLTKYAIFHDYNAKDSIQNTGIVKVVDELVHNNYGKIIDVVNSLVVVEKK